MVFKTLISSHKGQQSMERSDTKEASLVIALFNSLRELPDDDAGKRNHS